MTYQQKYKQKNEKKEYQQELCDDNIPALPQALMQGIQNLRNDSIFLGNQFIRFKIATNCSKTYCNTDLVFFEKWLFFSVQANEIDLLEGKLNENKMKCGRQQLHKAPSEEILFKSFDFFDEYPWSARFSSIILIIFFFYLCEIDKFAKKFRELDDSFQSLLMAYVCHYLQGYVFYKSSPVVAETAPYMTFFKTKIDKKLLVWMVGVECIPVLDRSKVQVMSLKHSLY